MDHTKLHQRPPPSRWTRIKRAVASAVRTIRAGRPRHEPHRVTTQYARMRQVGSWNLRDSRPMIKPVPTNLRYFSRTPYATRAIQFFTRSICSLDWAVTVKKDVTENSEIKRQIDVTSACLFSPNHDDSFDSLLQQVIEDILVCGAGAIEQQIGGDKLRPLWLWPVDALSIQIYADWDGDEAKPRYCQTFGFGNVGVAQGRDLLNRELVYMRDRITTDSPFAFGALEVAFESINRLLGVAEYAGDVAANAHPQNLLFLQGADQTTIEAFRAYWRNDIEGQGMTPIVGGTDAKVQNLRGTDDSALFLKYQEFVIREIAVAFGISAQNLGVEQNINRNNGEVAEDRDWDLSIKPLTRTIAAYINREVIWGRLGFTNIQLTPGGLDREDEKATAEIYQLEYKNNAITPNEYRARRNLPPLKSRFGDMISADAQIAIEAAKGAKTANPALTSIE
ncbi:phage portal protein [Paraburkholderia caribensis]|uniref:phage portal protein n=1 Tax=Paraburkholderia caribensis TaxID=75105 RepID=UPI00285BE00D|nr:phage portal protein [Paraburkholderia caribensis]MDR6381818.1 HK97 family phage portal protein [Paraburkholderia caribensis]